MASPIKNVILVGAGGNLGPSILKAFLSTPSLSVSVLTRPDSKSTFPSTVKVLTSDYTPASLRSAFQAHDAVVSLVGTPAFSTQRDLVDAAIAAGVKRFIPSDFGSNTASAEVRALVPFLAAKRDIVEYLQTKQAEISWSSLITGPFFDWGLKVGFLGFDLAAKKATLWDGGEAAFAGTNLATIGKATVNLLADPAAYEKAKNSYVYIASHVVNQKQILAALEQATGGKWDVVREVDAAARADEVGKELAKGDYGNAAQLILAATFGKEKGLGVWGESWNEALGLEKEDLGETVRAVVEGRKP